MLSDNATQLALAIIAIVGTCVNLVLTSSLNDKQKKQKRVVEDMQASKPPNTEDVIALYSTAEKSLEAINKLLRKHGRTVQANAQKLADTDLDAPDPRQLEAFPEVRRALRRYGRKSR